MAKCSNGGRVYSDLRDQSEYLNMKKNLLLLLAITGCFWSQLELRSEKEIGVSDSKDFYAKFCQADPKTRFALVFEAIDSGAIRLGMSRKQVEKMFREKLTVIHEKEEYCNAVALFTPIDPPSHPLIQFPVTGWYVRFRFDENGVLKDYYITKRHPFYGNIM